MARRKAPASTAPLPPTSSAPASAPTRSTRTYESTPVLHQATFPPRRKVVRTYGRRSLPAGMGELPTTSTPGSERLRRSLRQQTLTQIDYVRSSSGLVEEADGGLREPSLEEEEEMEGLELGEDLVEVQSRKQRVRIQETVPEKQKNERRSKRRKTMGDAPTPTAPALERKGSSFHTQTLTQFLGTSTTKVEDDLLRVDDEEQDEEAQQLPLPGPSTPAKRRKPATKGKAKAVAPAPSTPSHQRIKVDLDEVPSSQPTPFTPMLGYSPIATYRSPLTQKSTNVDAPLPTVETISKLPRNLVIQDSYSMGSSSGFSSSAAETPKKEEQTPYQEPKREPLTEIPVASLELGVGSTPTGETPTARRKRMFFEIPDSEDELESIASTPFRTRSAQQTPLKQ